MVTNRRRRFDVNAGAWFAILAGYSAFLGYLLVSGRIIQFMHPRMVPFVVFGLALLCGLCASRARHFFCDNPARRLKPGTVLFVLPFAFIPLSLGSTSAVLSDNGRTISLYSNPEPVSVAEKLPPASVFAGRPGPAAAAVVPPNGTIELSEKTYFQFYSELNSRPELYAGREIHVTGFVYHGNLRGTNRFIAGRELMSCCAADAVTIGFVTEYDGSAALPDDQWVSVTGVLGSTEYTDEYTKTATDVPLIKVTSIETMKKMDYAYVYPAL